MLLHRVLPFVILVMIYYAPCANGDPSPAPADVTYAAISWSDLVHRDKTLGTWKSPNPVALEGGTLALPEMASRFTKGLSIDQHPRTSRSMMRSLQATSTPMLRLAPPKQLHGYSQNGARSEENMDVSPVHNSAAVLSSRPKLTPAERRGIARPKWGVHP